MFTSVLDACQFNGEAHFKNHVNYLFRTDKGQKWTNDATEYCVVAQKDENKKVQICFLGDSLTKRRKYADALIKTVKALGFDNRFRMQAYYYDALDVLGEEITEEKLKAFAKKFINDIEAYGRPKNQMTICYVLHVDQDIEENLHVHRVFIQN